MSNDGIIRVPADKQYAHVTLASKCLDQLSAAHFWHHDVGNHQIDRAGVVLKSRDRFLTITRLQHAISTTLQNQRSDVTDLGFIFYKQDCLCPDGRTLPLLIVHFNGGSIADVGAQIDHFRKGYKVIAMDSRDQGKSGDSPDKLTYEKMTDEGPHGWQRGIIPISRFGISATQ